MLAKREHDVVSAMQRSAHVFTREKTDLLVREEEHRQQVLIGVLRTLPRTGHTGHEAHAGGKPW